ncbi:hypothetical protein [Arthrobacter sp. 35W]|uniref:hypothetical protein n=1 Tax=Arthrobacter sp. 35W TaxID=1132441 RepID=UPI000401CDA6|nr:hypothetical protein [Arthrobacter sp. 35W]
MIAQQILDELWDFGDPAGSGERFRAAMAADGVEPEESAELATQVARTLGLQGLYADAFGVLDALTPHDAAVAVRIELERGRVLNSSGQVAAALPHFELAAVLARTDGLHFLQVDALHMLAIADSGHIRKWTTAALAAIDDAGGTPTELRRLARWRVPLLNNLGSALADDGEIDAAVAAFRGALEAADEVGTPEQQAYAHEALDEALAAQEKAPKQE